MAPLIGGCSVTAVTRVPLSHMSRESRHARHSCHVSRGGTCRSQDPALIVPLCRKSFGTHIKWNENYLLSVRSVRAQETIIVQARSYLLFVVCLEIVKVDMV